MQTLDYIGTFDRKRTESLTTSDNTIVHRTLQVNNLNHLSLTKLNCTTSQERTGDCSVDPRKTFKLIAIFRSPNSPRFTKSGRISPSTVFCALPGVVTSDLRPEERTKAREQLSYFSLALRVNIWLRKILSIPPAKLLAYMLSRSCWDSNFKKVR